MKGRRGKKRAVGLVIFLLLGAVYFLVFFRTDKKNGANAGTAGSAEEGTTYYKEETVQCGDLMQSMTESGSIELRTVNQKYDVVIDQDGEEEDSGDGEEDGDDDEESSALKIEEIFIRQGQRIQEGDAVLKLTEKSIRQVRRKLEMERTDAELVLKSLRNACEIGQVEAESARQQSLSDAVWAETRYAVDTAEYQVQLALLADSVAVLEQEIVQIETELEDGWEAYADLKAEYEKYERRCQEWAPDNLYTYIPLRTDYLRIKEQYETETENRLEKREEMEEKREEIAEKQAELERLQGRAGVCEMESRQSLESAVLDGDMAQEVYAYTLEELEQNLEAAEAKLAKLEESLSDLNAFVGDDGIVYAQSDGLVTRIGYEAGDLLQEESVLFTYVKEDDYVISIDVSEEDIPYVTVGDEVTIVFTADPDTVYTGRIGEISSANPSENTIMVSYPVTVRIEGDTKKLYGGMTGDVTFVTDQVQKVNYVSRKAIVKEDGKAWVLVQDENGEMIRREVETGFTDGVHIQIISGLSEGDTVYVETRIPEPDSGENRAEEGEHEIPEQGP